MSACIHEIRGSLGSLESAVRLRLLFPTRDLLFNASRCSTVPCNKHLTHLYITENTVLGCGLNAEYGTQHTLVQYFPSCTHHGILYNVVFTACLYIATKETSDIIYYFGQKILNNCFSQSTKMKPVPIAVDMLTALPFLSD